MGISLECLGGCPGGNGRAAGGDHAGRDLSEGGCRSRVRAGTCAILTERAKEGKFSAWPMIMALVRAELEAGKALKRDVGALESKIDTAERVERTEQRLEVSDALRKSMAKWDRET
jgi:hypothetical protein